MPEDKSFIYKTEAQRLSYIGHNTVMAFYHMTSNGVFYYFGCIMATYLYQRHQKQPIFQGQKQ